ncbi:winged helix-turn-helix transcriptional regulator [Actinophytocola gossypii]|uniref:Transcriptional regulator n=1 Tax=Actinophytocola gossypii TaxID=2812003 RepID=A0ABT2JG44_9PSEU|nr:winged helix-turn-helix transcriptional regulator [Actinophytocola gossypii]MCT2586830.1 transcriptional regulator [Actinophytocola gossypii]
MDEDGLTISGDQFSLTTTGAEPTQLEAVVAELQGVSRATYGQYCGLSRAAEMLGERWGMLIIRDLITRPKTVAQLHSGLPRISEKALTMRLREMVYSGVIRELDERATDGSTRYELTEYGRAAEDALLALGRWGAMSLASPRPEDIVTPDSLMVAIKATFKPRQAHGVHLKVELQLGAIVLHVKVDDGELTVGSGPLAGADAVINPGMLLKDLMTRDLDAEQALATGQVTVDGDPAAFLAFVDMFELPRLKAPVHA